MKKPVTTADIDALIRKVGEKRDEVRKLTNLMTPLVQSLEEADEEFGTALRELRDAKLSIERAADAMSQYA